jgi:hypothetical protein
MFSMAKKILLVFIIAFLAGACTTEKIFHPGDKIPQEIKQASINSRLAAEKWLTVMDSGNYTECWQQTSSIFQKLAPEKQWIEECQKNRGKLGTPQSRKCLACKYTDTMANTPTGKCAILKFKTEFKTKKAIETVTVIKTEAGEWKVSGYYLK